MATSPAPGGVLTVSALTRLIKDTLAGAFPAVWVRGEISGFKRADSGHLYFSLKEGKDAVLACAMWKGSTGRLAFRPADGGEVEAFGYIDVYPPRGGYQLIVQEMRPAGMGALLLALEELKRRLQAEGLFDPARKRPLPAYPRTVGVVTSPVGAAVRDIVKVLRARWPSIRIVLAPVRVQGEGAAAEIAEAIGRFDRWGAADVLIVGRGGGSLEDLWAFNEEAVVRAIAGSRTPVVSAVGHEVDTTLADHAADVRAATPSNAAELVVRDRAEVVRRVALFDQRLGRAVRLGLIERRRRLETLLGKYGFRRQREALSGWRERVRGLVGRLALQVRSRLDALRARVTHARTRYGLREWPRELAARRHELDVLAARLQRTLVDAVHSRRTRLAGCDDRLRALSPRRVLERGYCLVRLPDGRLQRTATGLGVGDPLTIEFARGEADARVEAVRRGDEHGG
ncbi:MAG: exodeoxyribonuclease VII large subunit [Candidatus Eisenbacteria bacterium]